MSQRGRPKGSLSRPDLRHRHSTVMRVLVALRHGGATFGDIVAITGRRKSTVYEALHAARKRGLVQRRQRGWYELTRQREQP